MTVTDPHWPQRLAILGVGLLGGSVALATRRRLPETQIVGWARNQEKCDRLVSAGIVDHANTSVEAVCRDADLVLVATPVDRIAPLVIAAAKVVGNDCLITDVGSTKAKIVGRVAADPVAAKRFVAAHPIAGSEKTGFEHATSDLFDDKPVVITPSPANDADKIGAADRFWRLVGGRIHTLSPVDHDTHLAAISHLPHLVSALVARMATADSRPLAGSGWEDITRVAAGDPGMWTAICLQNRGAILSELDRFAEQLNHLRVALGGTEDQIHQWLAEAKRSKEGS